MKKQKFDNLGTLELENEIKIQYEELSKMRFNLTVNEQKDTSLLKKVRKNISRILTLLEQKRRIK